MFTATGNWLAGSKVRDDFIAIYINDQNNKASETTTIARPASPFDVMGMVPLMSTVSGLARALLGVVHTIVHLACAIFDAHHRAYHLEEAVLGLKNIAVGLCEMVPIFGNIVSGVVTMRRFARYKDMIDAQRMDPNGNLLASYYNQTILYSNGVELARMDTAAFKAASANVGYQGFGELKAIILKG